MATIRANANAEYGSAAAGPSTGEPTGRSIGPTRVNPAGRDGRIPAGLFADAERGEDPAEQVVGMKPTRDFTKGIGRGAEFFGQQLAGTGRTKFIETGGQVQQRAFDAFDVTR